MSQENADGLGPGADSDQQNADKGPRSPQPNPGKGRLWCWVTALLVAVSLFVPLAQSGIWEPPEREIAELSRRIALNLLGGQGLFIPGAENEVPTRGELGRGELPFTSIALGFRAFGLHEWAGRLPLALWGMVALGATYLLVRRLCDRRAACFALLVLLTMPLFYLQARTMLGEIVTIAALTLAWAGLGLAVFDRDEAGVRPRRAFWLGLGILGMLCGVLCRGVLIGVSVPAFSVGAAWFALRSARLLQRERAGDWLGFGLLLFGLAAAALALRALFHGAAQGQGFSWIIGSSINPQRTLPTFDQVLLQLGHALFPWSAVLPVALGALLRAPPVIDQQAWFREAALRALVLSFAASAYFAYGISAPLLDPMPFAAVSALAVAVALFTVDAERGSPPSRSVPMVVCAFAILLLVDFKNFPEKALSAFSLSDVHFPESFRSASDQWLAAGTLLFVASFFFSLQERSTHETPRFDKQEYLAWPRVLRQLWAGNLLFALLVVEAALVGLSLLGVLADHVPAFSNLEGFGSGSRSAALLGAVALPVLVVSPLLLLGLRDAFRTLFDPELASLFGEGRLGRALRGACSRPCAAMCAGVLFGACLSLGYYPLLAARISPKQVFGTYRREARSSEPLGVLGAQVSAAAYYAGRSVPAFDTAKRAFEWLTAGEGRRWLVIRGSDLAALNGWYRARREPPRNLPVLDARSGEALLVSNELGGARNENPLLAYLPEQVPHPSHPLDANLGDELDVLGWDALTLDGRAVASVEAGKRYVFVIYYRVVQPVSGEWETFIHIDGFQRRFNGDHPTLNGKYTFNLWHVGDLIADRSEFTLEPNFGAGRYRVYFGLYSGNRRLEVRRGPAQENRLDAGFLEVR